MDQDFRILGGGGGGGGGFVLSPLPQISSTLLSHVYQE